MAEPSAGSDSLNTSLGRKKGSPTSNRVAPAPPIVATDSNTEHHALNLCSPKASGSPRPTTVTLGEIANLSKSLKGWDADQDGSLTVVEIEAAVQKLIRQQVIEKTYRVLGIVVVVFFVIFCAASFGLSVAALKLVRDVTVSRTEGGTQARLVDANGNALVTSSVAVITAAGVTVTPTPTTGRRILVTEDTIDEHGALGRFTRRMLGEAKFIFVTYGTVPWQTVVDGCMALNDGYGVLTIPFNSNDSTLGAVQKMFKLNVKGAKGCNDLAGIQVVGMLEPGDSVDAMPPPLVVDCAAGAGLPCTLFTVERFVSGDAAAGVVEYPAYSLDNVTSTGRRRRMYGNACNPVNIDSGLLPSRGSTSECKVVACKVNSKRDTYRCSRQYIPPGDRPCGIIDCSGSCFSSDATVQVEGGGRKRMSELAAGDRVLTVRSDGSTAFDDVYLFGHKRAEGMHEFLQLQTSVNASLTLSKGHFVPVARGACSAAPAVSCSVTLPASNVRPGDVIFTAADGTAAAPATVISVTTVVRPGLYNPFTLGGRIVVDGVLASAHSDWFLDPLVPAAARRFLPAVYQAVLAPVRLLYRLVPRALAQVDAAVHAGFKDGWYDVSVSQVANLAVTALASAA